MILAVYARIKLDQWVRSVQCNFRCFSVQEGTSLDGFAINDQWVGPLKSGSLLKVGPLCIKARCVFVSSSSDNE